MEKHKGSSEKKFYFFFKNYLTKPKPFCYDALIIKGLAFQSRRG
jgi:hypothetical protein